MENTYIIIEHATPRITCLVCGHTSYNINDIKYLFCNWCHAFHNIELDGEGKPIATDSLQRQYLPGTPPRTDPNNKKIF